MSINEKNYKEKLLDYMDNRLSPGEVRDVEQYLLVNSDAWAEMEALKRIRLKPDNSIIFRNKMRLMRVDDEISTEHMPESNTGIIRRINRWQWNIIAGAAALLLLALLFRGPSHQGTMASTPVAVNNRIQDKAIAKTETKKPEYSRHMAEKNVLPHHHDGTARAKAPVYRTEAAHPEIAMKDGPVKQKAADTAHHPQIILVEAKTIQPIAPKISRVSEKTLPGIAIEKIPETPAIASLNADYDTQTEDDGINPLQSLLHFFRRNVKVQKETIGGGKYYAVSIETQKVSIYKTIRAEF